MKKLFITLILTTLFFNCFSQDTVVNSTLFDIKSQTPKNNKIFKEDAIQIIGIQYKKSNISDITIYFDGKDISSLATIRETSVHYIQKSILFEGVHHIKVLNKEQVAQWKFVTSSPPEISNWRPLQTMISKDAQTIISADFADKVSGIDLSSINLK